MTHLLRLTHSDAMAINRMIVELDLVAPFGRELERVGLSDSSYCISEVSFDQYTLTITYDVQAPDDWVPPTDEAWHIMPGHIVNGDGA